ncbi:MAG: NADP oxidoreductase [Promethearchaeota archaeon]|nr:MAG: NADP oxidoreductase [Candidatus Lokiarchaeota archaeon]
MTENEAEKDRTDYDYSFEHIAKKLEGKKDSYGMLMKEIVRTGICTECGTCAAVCDVLTWDSSIGQPKLTGKCTGCGICYNQCPRTITDPVQLLGKFKANYLSKTAIPDFVTGQDGGTIISLLCYLFDEHLIDAAVVTVKDPNRPWYPIAKVITTKEEALQSAGSIYAHSQTVEALMEAIRQNYRSIAFVGTPCNINAVDKMMKSPSGMLKYFMRANIRKLGLFCMDSFSPETLYPMFEKNKIDLSKIVKMDINKGKLHLYEEMGAAPIKSFTIRSLHKYKSSSCNFCTDLTAEKADISVGSVGAPPGKNSILARTGIGTEIIEDAAEKGYLSIEPNSINVGSLLFLAKLKKVSQYNVQKRRIYIIRDLVEDEDAKVEAGPVSDEIKSLIGARRALSIKKNLNEPEKILNLTITNTIGYTLFDIKVRVATIDEVFEKNPWATEIKELFPFETIEIAYNVDSLEGSVLVEVVSDPLGKIFSRTLKYKPEEKK